MHAQGLGPATASAILSAASTEVAYMSDEAVQASGGKKGSYTMSEFLKMASALRAKAQQLAESSSSDKRGDP